MVRRRFWVITIVLLFLLGALFALWKAVDKQRDALRQPEVLYLGPTAAPELWRVGFSGTPPVQLTSTGGKVYDYGVSRQGGRIAYSARNNQGGLDLWEIDRKGGTPHLLLPCQTDWCFQPSYSPDGRLIAYSRRQMMSSLSATPSHPRIWLLDMKSFSTEVLLSDPHIEGIDASWSLDGKFLLLYDGRSGGIHVVNLDTRQHSFFAAATGANGTWSPDSKQIAFSDSEQSENGPVGNLLVADIQTQTVSRIFAGELGQVEYGTPDWSPSRDELAVSVWHILGSAGKQIWIVGLDGRQRAVVTQDQVITNTSYHWSPTGDQLVFQRLALGGSDYKPWIAVWNRGNGDLVNLAEDAFQPRWLP